MTCHWCKKPGHLKRDCFAWKRKQAASGGQSTNTTDCIEENDVPEILNVIEESDGGSWIVDSGCSFHLYPNISWFEELIEVFGSVILGNNQVYNVKGIGTVRLKMHDGSVKILNDVRYIIDIKRNLISLGLLELKGCSFTSSGGKMEVKKGSEVGMIAERRSSLYYLSASVIKTLNGELNVVKSESIKLWHIRLGYPAFGSIKELARKEIIQGVDANGQEPWEEYILGKSRKQLFPTGKLTSTSHLDYVQSDLWGPAQTITIGGGRYYMSLIDD